MATSPKSKRRRENRNKKQDAKAKAQAKTLGEFLGEKGLEDASSGWILDKLRGNKTIATQSGQKRFEKERAEAEAKYQEQREKAIEEYKQKVENGELREKTDLERRLEIAQGDPNNASVQAMRRTLEKRGIDWKTGEPIATNARALENMNATQLKNEIATVENKLSNIDKKMDASVAKNKTENIGLIPMTQLYRGRENQIGKSIDKSVKNAVEFASLTKEKEGLTNRLSSLQKAYNNVNGTNLTGKEKAKATLRSTANTMSWTTSNGQFGKVYSSGSYEIRRVDGISFIYDGGKQVGMVNTLKDAKAYVETLNKKKKK